MPLKQPPIRKNDEITLQIDALNSEGSGVGRVDGFAVFVPGALSGERVRAHVIKVTGSYAVAKALEILSPAPERARPRCAAYAACGGCTLQHLSYPAQLLEKQRLVSDALKRLGGFSDPPVGPTHGMEDPWRYRNKGSFPFGGGDVAVFGFYAARSHRLVPIADCPIQDERVLDIARRVAAWAAEQRVLPYDETTGKGQLRHVMARISGGGETLAVVVTKGPLPKQASLIEALEDVDSLWHNQNGDATNVIFGERFTLLAGAPRIHETVGGLRFSLGPQSFLQVNPIQTARLYDRAIALLAPQKTETLIDAYCGIGTISLMLAGRAAKVIGIEQVAAAIEDARENARQNGIGNAEFHTGAVEDLLPKLLETEAVSALVLDPPRKGCDEAALQAIGRSRIQRLVYISCNPATLARDCKLLASYGFSLDAAEPVDMFPQTSHVETVCLMSRVKIERAENPYISRALAHMGEKPIERK